MAPLLLALIGLVLLIWGLWIFRTGFAHGCLPIAGWHRNEGRLFTLTWLIVFVIVLFPACLYAIGLGWQSLWNSNPANEPPKRHWMAALGISVLLCVLTFSARFATTAWFHSPMHPPFSEF